MNKETGRPLIRNYTAKEYLASPQNSAVLQNPLGLIYVGSNEGAVLEFDGVHWRYIKTPKKTSVLSLASDEAGRVYVGAIGDFGFLAADSQHTLHFQSLLEYVKAKDRKFTEVHFVHVTSNGVYFQSRQRIFCWKNDHVKVWKPQTVFINSFWLYGDLYVYQQQVGLMKMEEDSLQLISGVENFSTKPVLTMLPYPDAEAHSVEHNPMLIGIAGEGLFLYDGRFLRPFEGVANQFIRKNGINCSAVLNDSTFAIGTLENGVVVFDSRGEIIQIINAAAGLASNTVYSIMPGREGEIWLATLQGISRVNSIRPLFTNFDERDGLKNIVLPPTVRHENILYVRTPTGIYYFDHQQSQFFPVSGLNDGDWKLFHFHKSLFAINQTLRKIDGHSSIFVKQLETEIRTVQPSVIDSNRIYIGPRNGGLKFLQKEKGDWVESQEMEGIIETVENVAEEPNGDIWFGALSDGLTHVRFYANRKNPEIQHFGTEHGLPQGRLSAFRTSLYPVFTSNKGLFRFDDLSQMFIPDTTFGRRLADGSQEIVILAEDSSGNIWTSTFEGGTSYLNVSYRQKNGSYLYQRNPFQRIPSTGIWSIFPENNNIIWFGGEEDLFRYDRRNRKSYAVDFPALVRRVIANPGEAAGDSVIYGGTALVDPIRRGEGLLAYNFDQEQLDSRQSFAPMLDYPHNTLRFEYAATSFELPSANRYQFFLEGFDKGWSGWTRETQRDYTNIPEGSYTFRVRAKNVYEHLSSEGRFYFKILPPWYRSWWAYGLYGFLFISCLGLVVYGYNKRRTGQLQRRTRELERVVAERTVELAEKNIELQEMNTLKSRFFANISHEFRTPLTLILGQIESLLPDLKKEHNINRARMALRNGRQLQQLINQLLDLSKFDAREMTLCATEQNIVPLLQHLTGSFESLAEQRNITLEFESSEENIPVYFEQDKVEKIMHNLLSNALKFTREGGRVIVYVGLRIANLKDQTMHLQNQSEIRNPKSEIGEVIITVRDTGIGIPKDRLPHIFDRFFQADSSTTREFEGTGIGLALTKELVQIHGGGISVESREGVGTTFTVTLPLGKAHLKAEQISDSSVSDLGMRISDLKDQNETYRERVEIPYPKSRIRNPKSKKSEIILIVEDNPDMRAYIRENLAEDYCVLEAANGEEGFAIAIEEIPDLIFTDVMMPKIDGYELTRRLREDQATSHIPIIMLTAKAEESDRFEGLETGVDAFLIKPFSTRELQIRVRKLIELRQQLRRQIGAKAVGLSPSEIAVSSLDQQFLQRLQDAIEENMENEDFSVDDLAAQMGVGKRQLQRKLKALTDCSPTQCIRAMRLQRAKQLLEQGAGNVTEVAFSVGYSDLTAFSRAFREEFNQLPSAIIPRK